MFTRENWRARGLLILSLVILHLALIYALTRETVASAYSTTGPPMFGPIIARVWRELHQHPMTSKAWTTKQVSSSSSPPVHWRFPPIDIWPTANDSSHEPTSFTPLTDAVPELSDSPAAQQEAINDKRANPSHNNLRMIRWVRPTYKMQWALERHAGLVQISIRINTQGQPVAIYLEKGSGFPELDQATQAAAQGWRFAAPNWRSKPIEVWARVAVMYHDCYSCD